MGVNSGHKVDFSWETLNGPKLDDLEGFLVRNFRWTLWLGDLEDFLVEHFEWNPVR